MDEKKSQDKKKQIKEFFTGLFGLALIGIVCYSVFFDDSSNKENISVEENIPVPPVRQELANAFHVYFKYLDEDPCFANIYAEVPWDRGVWVSLKGRWRWRENGFKHIQKQLFDAEIYDNLKREVNLVLSLSYTPAESEALYRFYDKEITKFIIQKELWGIYTFIKASMLSYSKNPDIKDSSFDGVLKIWMDNMKKPYSEGSTDSPFQKLLERINKTEQEFIDSLREIHRRVESPDGGYILRVDKGRIKVACASNKK